MLVKLCSSLFDLFFERLLFVVRSLSLELGHSALHLLDCKILLVEQLLLSLSFDLKLVDISLQVSRGREGTRDVANEVGLLSTKFEKLLRFFEKSLFL